MNEMANKALAVMNGLDDVGAALAERPLRNTVALVAATSVLFYAAERGRNTKVNDLFDAMVYCSTCLNVGYGDIFARTPAGKLLGTALMTIGPSMAAKTTDGVASKKTEVTQEQMLVTLQAILAKLTDQARQTSGGPCG